MQAVKAQVSLAIFTGSPELAAGQRKSTKFCGAGSFVIMPYKPLEDKKKALSKEPDQAIYHIPAKKYT